jgi:serine/threonine protein kinase/Tol biopolymer transport system component
MALTPGTRVGPYEILAAIGAGGMGEVYKARDTRLGRNVAIKVLPASFAIDGDRLRRFEQEARTVAQLSHPGIVAIFDVGLHEGAPYLVTELLEGDTVRDRLKDGGLSVRKAVDYALQIANGLAAAHEQGIVHRDLKPENLFLTRDGRLKILDFGLAKLAAPVWSTAADEATALEAKTTPGVVLGTVGYMSPEQVRGDSADHRTDVFAFGVVLYELLSGRRAFGRDTPAETMTAILKDTPAEIDDSGLRVPPALSRIVLRCLEKDPSQRFQNAKDLAFALENLSGSTGLVMATPVSKSLIGLPWLLPATTVVFAIAAIGLAALHFREEPRETRLVSFIVPPPDKSSITFAALSPDGKRLAFRVTEAGGRRRLWVRALDALTPQPLDGTEEGDRPFWSPDSRFLGFFAGKQLRKIEVSGGPVQTITDVGVNTATGAAWSQDGTIIFALNLGGIQRIPAQGGPAERLTTLDAAHKETRHYFPNMLPDGDHFTYVVTSAETGTKGLWITSISNPRAKRRLLADLSQAVYSQGYLLFVRGGTLMAHPFDSKRMELSGEPVPVVDRIEYSAILGFADFSISQNGTLAYIGVTAPWRLTWFDRTGKSLGAIGAPGSYQSISISPDESRVATEASSSTDPHYELYLVDPIRGTTTQLTFGAASGNFPTWSPDGGTIAFGSNRDGAYDIYQKSANSPGQDVVVLRSEQNKFVMDWSRDGRNLLLYGETDSKTGKEGLWVLPMAGERKPVTYLPPDFEYRDARFSPDGRLVAYASDEASTVQVFVQSFPSGSGRWQISTQGGSRPRWRADGRELYYLAPGGKLMAVDVKPGAAFNASPPKLLFETWIRGYLAEYDVSHDGQKFVMLAPEEGAAATPATLLLNWTTLLKK